MAMTLSDPFVAKQEPRCIVGFYCTFEGDHEDEGWSGSYAELVKRVHEIPGRVGDARWYFLYRPHKDHPDISTDVRSAFAGVEVAGFDDLPPGLSTTRFAGGDYVFVEVVGDTEAEMGEGVGPAVERLEGWLKERGYGGGDEGALVRLLDSESGRLFRCDVCCRIVA